MLGPNATMLNTTLEDIFPYPGTNSTLLPPPTTLRSLLTNLSLSLLPSLDYSQLLYQPQCPGWVPLNHVYYQLANLLLLLSSLAPNTPYGFLFLRILLLMSFSLSTVWGWTVACGLDTTAWNCLLAAINLAWCLHTIWKRRNVSLSPEMETVFNQIFKPLNVSRKQFKVSVNLFDGVFLVVCI